jgi:hypothetical protein
MTYHITGLISAAIFLLTISGLWAQLKFVRIRRQQLTLENEFAERPTAVISVNQFVSSFLAFFSFFLYGACLERFDHYLVWPRLAASILTLVVLFDIMRDRRDVVSSFAFVGCTLLLAGASLLLVIMPGTVAWVRTFSQGLILVATVIMAQGYLHQVVLIRQTGTTGGVSARLHQFFFLKDVSTIAFSLAMGVSTGWPVLLLSTVSAATKLITLWHFRWARLSPLARQRREIASPRIHNNLTVE